jgi:hypothetical protein
MMKLTRACRSRPAACHAQRPSSGESGKMYFDCRWQYPSPLERGNCEVSEISGNTLGCVTYTFLHKAQRTHPGGYAHVTCFAHLPLSRGDCMSAKPCQVGRSRPAACHAQRQTNGKWEKLSNRRSIPEGLHLPNPARQRRVGNQRSPRPRRGRINGYDNIPGQGHASIGSA